MLVRTPHPSLAPAFATHSHHLRGVSAGWCGRPIEAAARRSGCEGLEHTSDSSRSAAGKTTTKNGSTVTRSWPGDGNGLTRGALPAGLLLRRGLRLHTLSVGGRHADVSGTQPFTRFGLPIRTKPYIWEFAPESGLVRLGSVLDDSLDPLSSPPVPSRFEENRRSCGAHSAAACIRRRPGCADGRRRGQPPYRKRQRRFSSANDLLTLVATSPWCGFGGRACVRVRARMRVRGAHGFNEHGWEQATAKETEPARGGGETSP